MAYRGPSGTHYDFDITSRANEYGVQVLNQEDLDRDLGLAYATLFRWMQAARMRLPWMQAGYSAFSEVEPRMMRRMLVASQAIRLSSPNAVSVAGKEAVTRVEVGDVGRTTVEFRYEMLLGGEKFATGSTVMIVVAGAPGAFRPSPVPDDVRALSAAGPGEDGAFLRSTVASLPRRAPPGAYSVDVLVRYSDEDVNRHANHTAQARFLEDAKAAAAADPAAGAELRAAAGQRLGALAITYEAEVRALDLLSVRLSPAPGVPGALDAWVERAAPRPGPVARGRLLCGAGRGRSPGGARL